MATPGSINQNAIPTIALVGRVNVGKSSLFNRLIEEQKAIVSNVPGTTRTNNEGLILWRGKYIRVIDTGGLTFVEDIPLEKDVIRQTEFAMARADLIIFVTDGETGILPQEIELAKRIKRNKRKVPVVVVANKVDSPKIAKNIVEHEWKRLQFGEPMLISAASGRSLGDLLDVVYEKLELAEKFPQDANVAEEQKPIQVAIIGKPNAGKSSLFNQLIGEERVIVNEMAHTTREPYDTLMEYEYIPNEDDKREGIEEDMPKNKKRDTEENTENETTESTEKNDGVKSEKHRINFIDTAGIRRKSRVSKGLERQGVIKSIETLDKTDIVLLVIDGSETLSHQDMQLGGLLEQRAKSVIILVNKWDLSQNNEDEHRNNVKAMIYSFFPHLEFAPMLFVSGKTGYRIHQIFPQIIKSYKARNIRVANRALEQLLARAVKEHLPARGKGTRHPELLGMRQIGTAPPVFELYVKVKTSLHRSYLNFLERKLRESFGFEGAPIIIKLTKVKR